MNKTQADSVAGRGLTPRLTPGDLRKIRKEMSSVYIDALLNRKNSHIVNFSTKRRIGTNTHLPNVRFTYGQFR